MLSETTLSHIGTVYNSPDGTNSTAQGIVTVFWQDWDYSGVRHSVASSIGGASVQEWSYGSVGQPITLYIPHCPYKLWAALKALRVSTGTTYSAVLVSKELNSSAAELSFTFNTVQWLDLTTTDKNRRGTLTDVRNVTATLISLE
jgi:hypothetical protein